jgi:ATP-dependent Clp protease adaptor protein ClpS
LKWHEGLLPPLCGCIELAGGAPGGGSAIRRTETTATLAANTGMIEGMGEVGQGMIDGWPRAAGPDKDQGKGGDGDQGKTGIVTKTRPKTKKPSLYKVLLLNDDYTPMEFVVHVLEKFFQKGRQEATDIMLAVHRKGVGICGVFTYEVAEAKVTLVMDFARQHGHPLKCTLEKE